MVSVLAGAVDSGLEATFVSALVEAMVGVDDGVAAHPHDPVAHDLVVVSLISSSGLVYFTVWVEGQILSYPESAPGG